MKGSNRELKFVRKLKSISIAQNERKSPTNPNKIVDVYSFIAVHIDLEAVS
jgi:hypothetical protein